MNKRLGLLLIALPLCAAAALPYTFQAGQTISAAEINANFAYLNSRIDALGAGAVLTKVAIVTAVPPNPPQMVLDNTGTLPIEFLDSKISGSTAWFLTCGANPTMPIALPRFLPPACSLGARQDGAVLGTGGYAIAYRQ